MSVLTVFFDGRFWVAVLEVTDGDGRTRAARQVLGAEPTDAQLHDYLLAHGGELLDAALQAPAVDGPGTDAGSARSVRRASPKRAAREAAREAARPRPSTRAQESLSREREEQAVERGGRRRQERARQEREAWLRRRARAKRRHRGR